jgi:hypothetical protein
MGGEDAYKGRSVRRRRQRAGVGAVLVGLAAAASATVFAGGMQAAQPSADSPSADSSSRLEDWAPDALQAGEDIQTAVRRVEAAAREADLAGAKAACQQMSDANQRLKAMLPSPVPAVTSEVRGVVDEVDAASSLCLAAGPQAGQQNFGLFKLYLNAALAHYYRAMQIAQGG